MRLIFYLDLLLNSLMVLLYIIVFIIHIEMIFLKFSVNYGAYYAIPMYFRKFSKFKPKCRVFIKKYT